MKKTILALFWLWAILLATVLINANETSREQIAELNRELKETRQVMEAVYVSTYENESWIASLQTEVDNLKAQDEAFARLWLRK